MVLSEKDKKVLQQAILKKVLRLDRLVKEGVPVYTGRLRSSFQIQQKEDGSTSYFTNVEYARDVEYGSPPRTPDFQDLKRWVELVIQPGEDKLEITTRRISDKIQEKGTKPQPFLRPALERIKNTE